MTGVDHQHSETVESAAQWLAEKTPPASSIVPALRQRLNLGVLEACEAAALPQRYRVNRKAFG